MPQNENVTPPENEDDDEETSLAFQQPVYPRITRSQWAVLVAMTDQRCKDILDGATFYRSLSEEAKEWLQKADEEKIKQLSSTIEFMNASKIIWKFLWVGGGMIVGAFVGFTAFWKAFGEFFTVKIK